MAARTVTYDWIRHAPMHDGTDAEIFGLRQPVGQRMPADPIYALLKEPPEPRTRKCQSPPMREGHEHPAEAGGFLSGQQEHPPTQARFARAYFLPRGCSCPRLTLAALAQPRNTRAMPIKPSRISAGNTVYPAERGA